MNTKLISDNFLWIKKEWENSQGPWLGATSQQKDGYLNPNTSFRSFWPERTTTSS